MLLSALSMGKGLFKGPWRVIEAHSIHLFGRYSSKAYCVLSTVPSGGNREGMTAVEPETEVTYREYRRGCWCWGSIVTFLTQKEWEFLPGVRHGWGSWTPYSRAEEYGTNCREIATLVVPRWVEAKLELLGEEQWKVEPCRSPTEPSFICSAAVV